MRHPVPHVGIDVGTHRFHHVERQAIASIGIDVQYPDPRIQSQGDDGEPNLRLQDGI